MAPDTRRTGKLNKGRQQLVPHLLNYVFIGLDGAFHVNDLVELPREWPITACRKNEMGVVKLLGGQKVEQDIRPLKNRAQNTVVAS